MKAGEKQDSRFHEGNTIKQTERLESEKESQYSRNENLLAIQNENNFSVKSAKTSPV